MQIGQGESLVHFLWPALPNRPHQTVVVVKSGQDGLSQTLYLQKWPKSAFEIVVSIYRPKGGFCKISCRCTIQHIRNRHICGVMPMKCGGFCCLHTKKWAAEANFYPQTAENNINI